MVLRHYIYKIMKKKDYNTINLMKLAYQKFHNHTYRHELEKVPLSLPHQDILPNEGFQYLSISKKDKRFF